LRSQEIVENAIALNQKKGMSASIFDFSSKSVDEELENAIALWKYSITKVI